MHIFGRLFLAIFLVVYVSIALCNYSLVQSYIAGYVSDWFSQKTGGHVQIGSLYINPLGQVVIRDVQVVDPAGDTLADLGRLSVRFSGIPVSSDGLSLDAVMLSDTYYHFATVYDFSQEGDTNYLTNLEFIIAAFASPSEDTSTSHFVINVKNLNLRNIHYKMDLVDGYENPFPYGVDIAHMDYSNINGRFKNIRVDNDYIDCRIVSFSAVERSGFAVRDMSADISVSPYHISAQNMELNTDNSRILADASLEYNGWEGMDEYCDSVNMSLLLKPGSVGGLADACYWAPDIWGVDQQVNVEGYFYGPLADITAVNVLASFGEETEISLDGRITGLPYIEVTNIDAEIHKFHSNHQDLYSVNHPDWVEFYAEDIVRQLGSFDGVAEFHGDCHNWVGTVNISSEACDLDVNAAVSFDERHNEYEYRADLYSNNIDLSNIISNDYVTRTGLSVSLYGRGLDFDHLRGTIDGELVNTVILGNSIDATSFSGQIADKVVDVDLEVNDPLLAISAQGKVDFSDSITGYNAHVSLSNCNLTQLRLVTPSIYPTIVSAHLDVDLQGLSLNTMIGSMVVSDMDLLVNADELHLNRCALDVQRQRHNRKQLTLNSDWVKAELVGYFDYTNIPLLVRQFCDNYVPVYYNPFAGQSPLDVSPIADHYLNLDVRWIGKPHQLHALIPDLGIATGSSLHCSYNYMESLKLVMRSDSVSYGSVCFEDLGVQGTPVGDNYSLSLDADHVSVGAIDFMQKMNLSVDSRSSDATVGLHWGRTSDALNRGDLGLYLVSAPTGNRLSITRPTFFLDGSRWVVSCPDGVNFDNDHIQINPLRVSGNGQSLSLDGAIEHKYNDYLNVAFSDFRLDEVLRLFVQDEMFAIGGSLSGNGSLYGINDSPYFNSKLRIDEFTLGGQSFGLVDVLASWNAEMNQLNLALKTIQHREKGLSVPVEAEGYVELGGDDPELKFDIDLLNFDLSSISPFVSSFSSRLDGRLSGSFMVDGTLSSPTIEGSLAFDEASLLIDATGVAYSFSDSVAIAGNGIRFNRFRVSDPKQNIAYLDGVLDCSDFTKVSADLRLQSDNILALDIPVGDDLSGALYVKVAARVRGLLDDLSVTGEVFTNPGSHLTVPVSDRRVASSQNYITFVSDEVAGERKVSSSAESSDLPISIKADLHLTPDLRLSIPMDFMSQMFVGVGASGAGDLRFALENGEPSVTGTYEISAGTLSLNLAQLVSRKFVIESGSTLVFPGNISDTRFDIDAVYTLRTNVSTLTGGLSASESSQRTVTVEDVFKLSGTLDAPQLGFDIRLPNADQSVQEEVFAFIDRTNERDMLNQSASLLVLGQFSNASNAAPSDASSASGYQAVVNTMGSIVSSMVSFVDLNFDYHAATELTTEQFELDISKEWNRFYFESSFGYGGDARNFSESGYNNVVGDMLVGYKLSPNVHLFMFNRTNTNDYTRMDLPYRQGMGLKFTRDFDKWSDVVKFKKKKKTSQVK